MAYNDSSVRFEWDESKNLANQLKHNVSFEEARALFESGVEYLEMFDAEHSESEERFIAIGPIPRGVVIVIWTERAEGIVRIISARMASRRESELFRERMRGQHE